MTTEKRGSDCAPAFAAHEYFKGTADAAVAKTFPLVVIAGLDPALTTNKTGRPSVRPPAHAELLSASVRAVRWLQPCRGGSKPRAASRQLR
jgi:hypothetical protein